VADECIIAFAKFRRDFVPVSVRRIIKIGSSVTELYKSNGGDVFGARCTVCSDCVVSTSVDGTKRVCAGGIACLIAPVSHFEYSLRTALTSEKKIETEDRRADGQTHRHQTGALPRSATDADSVVNCCACTSEDEWRPYTKTNSLKPSEKTRATNDGVRTAALTARNLSRRRRLRVAG